MDTCVETVRLVSDAMSLAVVKHSSAEATVWRQGSQWGVGLAHPLLLRGRPLDAR